jgi:hypothetical protein
MILSRRRFLEGTMAGVSLAISGCAKAASQAQFTPEAFGATGNGVSDDYGAFERLVRAVNSARRAAVVLSPGKTYFLDRHVTAADPHPGLVFEDCDGLTIDGNGAALKVRGDFYRDHPTTRGLWGLLFRDSARIAVRNLQLNGSVDQTRRAPRLPESSSHGLIFQSCSDVSIDNVAVHHFAGDGLYIRESRTRGPGGTRIASRRFNVRNSRFLCNARQALSVIQLREALFDNCDFSWTGYVDDEGTKGPYGAHSPAAGVDIEPNQTRNTAEPVDTLTGAIAFRRCRMAGNYGAAFLASKFARGEAFLEEIRLEASDLQCNEGLTGGRDGFIFDVPRGEVTGCKLSMVDKTAFVGWYGGSRASPRFVGNEVHGRNRGPGRPLLVVRRTLGSPLIEGNHLIDETSVPAGPASWLIAAKNPNAIVRNNRLGSAL